MIGGEAAWVMPFATVPDPWTVALWTLAWFTESPPVVCPRFQAWSGPSAVW